MQARPKRRLAWLSAAIGICTAAFSFVCLRIRKPVVISFNALVFLTVLSKVQSSISVEYPVLSSSLFSIKTVNAASLSSLS